MLKHQFVNIPIHGAIVYLPAKNTSRNQPNVVKYISPMDGMSLVFYITLFFFLGGEGVGGFFAGAFSSVGFFNPGNNGSQKDPLPEPAKAKGEE